MTTMTSLRPGLDGWTIDDLDAMPAEGRFELIDGTLVVSPPESPPDLLSALRLCNLLEPALGPAWLTLPGGAGVLVDELSYCEPGVLVFARSAYGEGSIPAADVLLAYEAMSPSSRTMDRVTRPAEVRRGGDPALLAARAPPHPGPAPTCWTAMPTGRPAGSPTRWWSRTRCTCASGCWTCSPD